MTSAMKIFEKNCVPEIKKLRMIKTVICLLERVVIVTVKATVIVHVIAHYNVSTIRNLLFFSDEVVASTTVWYPV